MLNHQWLERNGTYSAFFKCGDLIVNQRKIENDIKKGTNLSIFARDISNEDLRFVFKYVIKQIEENIKSRNYQIYKFAPGNEGVRDQYEK